MKSIFRVVVLLLLFTNYPLPQCQVEKEVDRDTFSIIWISDTQDMAYNGYDHALQKMGSWIMANKLRLDIRYIVQTGDAVDNGASMRQWDNFDELYNQFRQNSSSVNLSAGFRMRKTCVTFENCRP